jgi:hypothetical protein
MAPVKFKGSAKTKKTLNYPSGRSKTQRQHTTINRNKNKNNE